MSMDDDDSSVSSASTYYSSARWEETEYESSVNDGSTSLRSSYYTTGMEYRKQKASRLAYQASRALQRRAEESERLVAEQEKNRLREVDYERNVTQLYTLIEKKRWTKAIERCQQAPLEARTWVLRHETSQSGMRKLKWRLLPIHTAVIFRAPVTLIKSLTEAYPESPQQHDDQHMLPLHLACRTVSSQEVVSCLVTCYPDALYEEDHKGRIPIDFLLDLRRFQHVPESRAQQKLNDMNRTRLIDVLEKFMEDMTEEDYTSDSSSTGSGTIEENLSSFSDDDEHEIDTRKLEKKDSANLTDAGLSVKSNSLNGPRKQSSTALPASGTPEKFDDETVDVSKLAIESLTISGTNGKFPVGSPKSSLSAIHENEEKDAEDQASYGEERRNDAVVSSRSNYLGNESCEDEKKTEEHSRKNEINLDPSPQLKDLIEVMTYFKKSYHGKRRSKLDVSHVRRLNACGAMKTLSKSTSNCIMLLRTKSVVSSLCAILRDKNSTEEERSRCIITLLNLATPPKNWEIMYGIEDLMLTIVKLLSDNSAFVRYNCCVIIFMLTKHEANRALLTGNREGLRALLSTIVSFQDGKDSTLPSRLVVLKILLSMSKIRQNSFKMARNTFLLETLTSVSGNLCNEENVLCMAIFTNITRDISNVYEVLKIENLVNAMVDAISSSSSDVRKCAVFALQNMTCSNECRQKLATPEVLSAISRAAFMHDEPDTKLGALYTIRNFCNEPSNIITITDTPGVTATLLALANEQGDEMSQYLACDALSSLSQWLRVTADSCFEKVSHEETKSNYRLPSLQVTTWNQWQ